MRQRLYRFAVACAFAFILAVGLGFASQPGVGVQKTNYGPKMADDFYDVSWSIDHANDSNLVVLVEAIDPRGEPRNPKIIPGRYEIPPEDGIQDLFVMAEPAWPGPKTWTKYTVKYIWKDFRKDAPWVKGIRVHSGVGPVVWAIGDSK